MLRVADHAARTDTGRARSANEDSYWVQLAAVRARRRHGRRAGGRGRVARPRSRSSARSAACPTGPAPTRSAWPTLVERANVEVYAQAQSDDQFAGMGTTLTVAYVGEDDLAIAHVGDSRFYVLRDGELQQLTDDHSLVGELVRRGQISRRRGRGPPAAVDHHPRAGDRGRGRRRPLLLAGPRRRRLPALLRRPDRDGPGRAGRRDHRAAPTSLAVAAQRLVAAANEAGGRDNITVILFRVEDVTPGDGRGRQRAHDGRRAGACAAGRATVETSPRRAAGQRRRAGRRATTQRPAPPAAAAAPAATRARSRAAGAAAGSPFAKGFAVVFVLLALIASGGWIATRSPSTSSAPTTTASSRSTPGCPTSCPAASTSTPPSSRPACPRRSSRPRVQRHGHRAQAALATTTRSTSSASSSAASSRGRTLSERHEREPRALRADPRRAAGQRRVRRRLPQPRRPARRPVRDQRGLERQPDLRRDLPRPLLRRAPRPPHLRCRSADPYLFPLAALLACFGLVEIYRIDDGLARLQAQWFVIGLGLFAATIVLLRDYRKLERYRYLIAIGGIVLLLLPRAFTPVNGAYLSIQIGSLSVQPAEFAKIAIVVFLAVYLRDTRQLLVTAGRRVRGRDDPAAEALRPDARGLGHGDAAAVLHPRHRLVGDVLRRVPGDDLRRDRPAVSSSSSGSSRSASAPTSSPATSATSPTASTPGSTRSTRRCSTGRAAAATSSPRASGRRPTAACSARASARRCCASARSRLRPTRPSTARCCPRRTPTSSTR